MTVRRAEFKRARKYRWRSRKRRPLGRLMRECYQRAAEGFRTLIPEMQWFRQDAVTGPSTTLATSQEVEWVNYGGTGTAASRTWGGSGT